MQHLFSFYKMPTIWGSKVNKLIREQVKVVQDDYSYIFQFLKFHIKVYLQSIASMYNLYHLCEIIYKSIF